MNRRWTTFFVALVTTVACSSEAEDRSVKHHCGPTSDGDGCLCSAFWNGPAPSDSIECTKEKFPDTICCARAGWPGLGAGDSSTGCSCTKDSSGCANGQSEVESCAIDQPVVGSSSGGTSSGGTTDECTRTGSCGPSSDNCECGTTCLHLGVGRYECGFGCQNDEGCASAKDPISGKRLARCSPGLDTPAKTYDGLCVED